MRGLNLPLEAHAGRTPEIIQLAHSCVAVSGSVALELLYRGKPSIVTYRANWFSMFVAKKLKKCKYISLVNLLADKMLYPEFLSSRCEGESMAAHVLHWLNDRVAYEALCGELKTLRDRVSEPGACDRAAQAVLELIAVEKRRERAVPRDRTIKPLADFAPQQRVHCHGWNARLEANAEREHQIEVHHVAVVVVLKNNAEVGAPLGAEAGLKEWQLPRHFNVGECRPTKTPPKDEVRCSISLNSSFSVPQRPPTSQPTRQFRSLRELSAVPISHISRPPARFTDVRFRLPGVTLSVGTLTVVVAAGGVSTRF